MASRLLTRFENRFWDRHANPKSGWSRVPTGPVLVYALYHRKWRLFAAGVVWAVVNPVLFSPPERDDAWMTRAVRAERWWIREEGNRTVGLSYPNICNTGGAVATVCAVYAAWRRRPAGTTLATALAVGLKLWWLRALVARYDDRVD